MSNNSKTGQLFITVPRYKNGTWEAFGDIVTREEKIQLSWEIAQESLKTIEQNTTLWAWPHDLPALALGHILLDKAPSMHALHREASVTVKNGSSFHIHIGGDKTTPLPFPPNSWKSDNIITAMHSFINAEGLWDDTGCFHRAGVYDIVNKKLHTRTEDIGRHNCVDRLAGWSVLNSVPLTDKVLLISARMTSSLCAKAIRAGFRIIVSRSAVTTASIAMMEEVQGTLVGFARTGEGRFTVFSDTTNRIKTSWL